ncbi:MAG: hypothetical protein ACLQJR_18315 [Stellaceae bacterium]
MSQSKRGIAIGECYREAGLRVFARPASDWIVQAVYVGRDGIEHARLVGAADRSQQKTLSADILVDRRRFERIDGAG